jgi:hypothetical protein
VTGKERIMTIDDGMLVQVRVAWNAWQTAEVHVADLTDIHWRQPTGAPRPLVHAYVDCTKVVSGEIPHACVDHATAHRLLVCVLKRSSAQSAYDQLVRLALRPDVEGSPAR